MESSWTSSAESGTSSLFFKICGSSAFVSDSVASAEGRLASAASSFGAAPVTGHQI